MDLKSIALSEYGAASIVPSPVNRMMTSFATDFREGIDINLGVGYVDESRIPKQWILEAQTAVLANPRKYRAAFNYGGSSGSKNLKGSLHRFLAKNKIGGLDEGMLLNKEIIVGSNGATSLLEGMAQVLKPGIVITSDPNYYIYCDYLRRMGYKVAAIPEDESGIRVDLLRSKTATLDINIQEIRFFYVVTVNNPTCSLLTESRMKGLIEFATKLSYENGREIPVVIDRAYESLVHDPQMVPLKSGFFYDEIGLVYEIGTLSKIFAPGLRIGYMIGENKPFLSSMIQRVSDVGFSASLINQEIASYLLDHYGKRQVELLKDAYRKKAVVVKSLIEKYLGHFLSACWGGQGGFYYYLTFKDIETDPHSSFFRYLSCTVGSEEIDGPSRNPKPRVAYIPGIFCVDPHGDLLEIGKKQLRLSYGFESENGLEKAVKRMRDAAKFSLACKTAGPEKTGSAEIKDG